MSRSSKNLKRSLEFNHRSDVHFYGLVLASIFTGIYLASVVFDCLYNENNEIIKSNLFVLNAVVLIFLVLVVFMTSFDHNGFMGLRLLFSLAIIGLSIAICTEVKHLLDSSDKDREETTQFILAVIAVIFSLLSATALVFHLMVRMGYL